MRRHHARTPMFQGKATAVRPARATDSKLIRFTTKFEIKAVAKDDAPERTFEGLAAVWDLDLGNDIIQRGTFKSTIKTWEKSNEAMPLLDSHDHFSIFSALGQAMELEERKEGLWSKWEVIPGADGQRVMDRLRPSLKTGRSVVGKMSIGFIPTKFSFEQPEGTTSPFDRVRIITEAELKEVSLVLFPMAPGAAIDQTSIKQFSDELTELDPAEIDEPTRKEMRRLATRIGFVLKNAKVPDDPAPPTPTTPPVVVTDPAAPTTQPTTSPTPTPASPTPSVTTTDPAATVTEPEQSTEEKSGPTVYLYGNALEQRLRKTLLGARLAGHLKDNTQPNTP